MKWRAEEAMRDLRSGRISEYEAERTLNDLYPDGYAVENKVRDVVRDAASGWGDDYGHVREIERTYQAEEDRKHREREREEREEREAEERREHERRRVEEEEYYARQEEQREEEEREPEPAEVEVQRLENEP